MATGPASLFCTARQLPPDLRLPRMSKCGSPLSTGLNQFVWQFNKGGSKEIGRKVPENDLLLEHLLMYPLFLHVRIKIQSYLSLASRNSQASFQPHWFFWLRKLSSRGCDGSRYVEAYLAFPLIPSLRPQTPIYSERVLPLWGCFFELRECRIRRKGIGGEEKKMCMGYG